MALNEYKPGAAFPGVIGRAGGSSPAWPQPVRAVADAPNVLFIVLDDTGFGQLGCYGSPIATPNLDALAAGGLLYTNMHTGAVLTSRSCIITGRNHHANATAAINELATGYPGYNGSIPFENGFLSEMLSQHGYNTYMIGKWHLMPSEFESAAGPYDRWPLGRGFDRFYGFLGGDTSQWYPDLVADNHQVEPPKARAGLSPDRRPGRQGDRIHRRCQAGRPAQAVLPALLHRRRPRPHHVAKEWADRYQGQFDDGWDAYRERVFARQKELGIMPADAELSRRPRCAGLGQPVARRPPAGRPMMEVFAGFLSHTDHHIGRLLDFLKETGEFDNTLIMLVSDNGASPEGGVTGTTNEGQFFNNAPEPLEDSLNKIDELGGPTTFNHYPWGWTWAGNTPFRRWKRETYRGGACDPFLVHWPAGINAHGEVRDQYAHIIDMVPTVLDALGIEPPATIRGVTRAPIHGVSFAPLQRPGRPDPPYHPVLRDVRPPLHRPRRLAGGVPVAGPVVHRGRQAVRHADHARDPDRPGRPPLGAVPRRRRPGREPQPGRAAPRHPDRNDRPVVCRGRQV